MRYVKKMVPAHRCGHHLVQGRPAGERSCSRSPEIGPDDLAFLQYTGGTTGGTKAAMLTHYNMLANQYQIMGPLGWR